MLSLTNYFLNFQALLFNPPPNSKPFSKGQNIVGQDLDLYIDCFVSFFCIVIWQTFPKFQALLFNPPPNSKPFSKGQNIVGQDLDLYIDCFVSCFRITPHNNDVLKVCLNPHSPPIYHFVLVNALHRIITQVRSDIPFRKSTNTWRLGSAVAQ